jgi:YggT family protein
MQSFLISLIHITVQVLTILIIVKVVISYFVHPFNPFRVMVDRLVEPLLYPIRRFLPAVGMLDFSPFILIILLQVLRNLLINLIITVF